MFISVDRLQVSRGLAPMDSRSDTVSPGPPTPNDATATSSMRPLAASPGTPGSDGRPRRQRSFAGGEASPASVQRLDFSVVASGSTARGGRDVGDIAVAAWLQADGAATGAPVRPACRAVQSHWQPVDFAGANTCTTARAHVVVRHLACQSCEIGRRTGSGVSWWPRVKAPCRARQVTRLCGQHSALTTPAPPAEPQQELAAPRHRRGALPGPDAPHAGRRGRRERRNRKLLAGQRRGRRGEQQQRRERRVCGRAAELRGRRTPRRCVVPQRVCTACVHSSSHCQRCARLRARRHVAGHALVRGSTPCVL